MKKIIGTVLLLIGAISNTYGQAHIDTIPINQTKSAGFNTKQYKAYKYTRVVSGATQILPFRMIWPVKYDLNPTTKYPLVIMLHGRGEAGSDNNYQLIHGGIEHQNAVNAGANGATGNGKYDGFVMFPQEPYGQWTNSPTYSNTQLTSSLSQVHDVIDSLIKKYRIDPERIVIHGLSSGGSGTWASLYHRPDLFAAALPMSTPGDLTQMGKIVSIPIWLFQGALDDNPIPYISQQVIKALRDSGAVDTDITRYTEYANTPHNTWDKAYAEPDFFPYILRFRKYKLRLLSKNPFCPGESAMLGFAENLNYYQWYKDGAIIPGANSSKLRKIVANGAYKVQYKVTASSTLQFSDVINISQDVAAPKPVVIASQSLILPSPAGSSLTLTGPAGMQLYEWSNGSTTQQNTISNSGNYSLKVKAAIGCYSASSDTFLVKIGSMGTPIPSQATNIKAIPISPDSVLVNWDNVTDHTGFEIYRSNLPNSGYTFVKLVSSSTLSFFDYGLAPSTGYYYKIRSVNKVAATLSSEKAYVETYKDATFPGIPQNLMMYNLTSQGQLTLKWNKSFDKYALKRYTVYSGSASIVSTLDTIITITVNRNQSYMFSVEAEGFSGNKSGKSNIVPYVHNGAGSYTNFYIKKDPKDLWNKLPDFAQLVPDRQVLVNTFGSIATSSPFALTPMLTDGSSPSTISSLSNTNFVNVPDYFAYRISGFIKASGTGGTHTFYSTSDDGARLTINNTVLINRNAPQGPVETSGSISLNANQWYPFIYEFFEAAGGQYLALTWKTPGVTKATIPSGNLNFFGSDPAIYSLPPNVNNFNGMSTPSEIASTNTKKVKLDVNFTSAPDPSILSIDFYRIQATSINANSAFIKIGTVIRNGNSSTISYIDSTNLLPSTKYYYAIRIQSETGSSPAHFFNTYLNSIGGDKFLTISSGSISAPTIVPTLQTVSGISNSIIKLDFIDNACPNESGFEIFKSQDPLKYFTKIGQAGKNAIIFYDSTGVLNTTYYYKLRAYNQGGTSSFSNVLSGTTLNIPNAPSNFKVSVAGPKHINMSWQNNSVSSGFGFSIYRSTTLNGVYTRLDSIPNPGLDFYQDTSTVLTQKYYFKVRAYNANRSAFSNIDSSSIYTPIVPSLSDWKMPVSNVTCNFRTNYANTGQYAAFKNNIPKLKTDLEAKKDFLRYLYIQKNDSAFFTMQLPIASEMPYGGLISFNIATTELSAPEPDSSYAVDEYFAYKSQYSSTENYPIIKLFSSVDGTNYTLVTATPANTRYSNDLNKVDITPDMAGKYIKISIKQVSNRSDRGGLLVSEIGAYRFLGPGVRHNYFLICGASVEKLHPYYMGLTQFRKQLAKFPDISNYGKDALIFNISKSGKATKDLRDSLNTYLNMHPNASYVIVHQGGNDINDSYNNMRPLTYPKLQSLPNAKNFIDNFTTIIKTIQQSGKIPLVSRMHFRDYKELCESTGLVPGGAANNAPGVGRSRRQENGSLPLNLLIDSLTKLYTPYAYNFAEKRSSINFYPVILNTQDILGGDGIHPNSQISRSPYNYSNYRVDSITNYWINYPIRYIYTGKFASPIDYNPGGALSGGNAISPECDLLPANKPNLLNLTIAAVAQAEKTKSGNDIWEARILVEQLGNKSIRIPYVNRLDSLRDYRSPANPTSLSASVVDGQTVSLSWLDNDVIETAYQVYKSNDNGATYKLVAQLDPNSSSYNVTGLNGDTLYTFYVRAINNKFKSGWTNLVTARPGVTYYSKSSGNVTNLATWGRNDDGSGTAPGNFATGSQVYVFANRPLETSVSTNWTVSGNYSKVVLVQGTKLKIAKGIILNGTLDMGAGSQLNVKSDSIPTLNVIDSLSTLIVSGNSYLKYKSYGTLKLDSIGIKTLKYDTVNIKGNLILASGVTLKGKPTVIKLSGNLILNDSMPAFDNISLILLKKSHQIDTKAGDLALNSLVYSDTSTITLLNGSKLRLGSSSGGGLLAGNNSTINIGSGLLSIEGQGALNPANKIARISSYLGTININSTSNLDSYIYPSISGFSFKNITTNINVGRFVSLKDSLKLFNTLKLKSGTFNTGNYLILASTNDGTARISKVEASATLTGNITWQRLIGPFKKLSTYYIGSPIKNDTVKILNNFFTVQGFNGEATTLSNWNEATGKWNGIKDPTQLIIPGKGYRVLMKNNNITYPDSSGFLQLSGPPVIGDGQAVVNNSGAFLIPITKSGFGWNFISNPYPCEIDWNAVGWDKTVIEDAFYVWDGAKKSYKVFKGAGGTGAPGVATTSMTSIINSGQGFMVKAKGAGNLSLTENVKKDTIQPSFFRMVTIPLIRINLRNADYNADEAIIRFYEDATKEFDAEYDAMKYYGSTQNIATMSGSDKLTINTLPYYSTSLSVPIYVQAYTDGEFFLDFSEMESFPSEVNMYLKDNTLGTLTDIRKQFSYAFTGTSLNSSSRFELVFQKLPTAQVLAYENNKSDVVESLLVHPNPAENNTTFSVKLQNPSFIDLMVQNLNGQVVYNAQLQGISGVNVLDWQIQKENVSRGIYYYKIKTEGKEFTGKLVVQ